MNMKQYTKEYREETKRIQRSDSIVSAVIVIGVAVVFIGFSIALWLG